MNDLKNHTTDKKKIRINIVKKGEDIIKHNKGW